jgi:hypothetical protein
MLLLKGQTNFLKCVLNYFTAYSHGRYDDHFKQANYFLPQPPAKTAEVDARQLYVHVPDVAIARGMTKI